MKSESIAIKSINNYRKRDIIAYLSLRYYLDATLSKKDVWAKEVAVGLSIKNDEPNFLKTKQFKSFDDNEIKLRTIYVPGPNDIIAESVLINECAKFKQFHASKSVYSYLLVSEEDDTIYKHYMHGWKDRYDSIKEACEVDTTQEVIYFDIKSFYPSISLDLARAKWNEVCNETKISESIKILGLTFLKKYEKVQKDSDKKRLLIGPMFSHLIANLVLNEIDETMDSITDNRYWRYVDDIIIIGTSEEVKMYGQKLTELLESLNLFLHEKDKVFQISAEDWLSNAQAVDQELSSRWMRHIGMLKQFILDSPKQINNLNEAFNKNNIRVDIPLISEDFRLKSRRNKRLKEWFGSLIGNRKLGVLEIVNNFKNLNKVYIELFNSKIDLKVDNILGKKSHQSLLRYIVGRLIYLASEKELKIISSKISHIPELKLHYEIIESLISLDISALLKLGSNAAQAAAQVIKIKSKVVKCNIIEPNEYEIQGLSIFKFHGISIEFNEETNVDEPLFEFASGNIKASKVSENQFLNEFGALHGNSESKHKETLASRFNEKESLSFDAMESGYGYGY
jgi:Txe/YoeB family toxin of Txe-Axe toxin-antitoxin module